MKLTPWKPRTVAASLILAGLPLAMAGCQSSMNGQTLPSAHYLRDDVQYYPHGPEFLLPNQVRALEEYKLRQTAIESGLDPDLEFSN